MSAKISVEDATRKYSGGAVTVFDLVSNSPHVGAEHLRAFPYERVMKPGMELMLEPCATTPDGMLGLFFGHTFLITDTGTRRVTDCPDELLVAKW